MSFKSNGYSLEKKEPKPAEIPSSGTTAVEDSQVSPRAQESVNEMGKDAAASSMQPPLTPPGKTEYLFKWISKDGTFVFTDNPLSVPEGKSTRKTGKSAVTATKNHRRGVKTRASTDSTLSQNKNSNNVGSLKELSGVAKSPRSKNSAARHSAIVELKPRNYEECVGALLIKHGQPENVQEMMELFEMAERSCAPYAMPR